MSHLRKQQGFSLIEIMVSLAVFSVVVIFATAALLSIVDGTRKTEALKSVINNLNFALEDMTRTIRVGNTYHCANDTTQVLIGAQNCPSGGTVLAFAPTGQPANNPDTLYVYRFITTGTDDQGNATGEIDLSKAGGASGSFIPITAPEVKITNFSFTVTGAGTGDSLQPKVFLIIKGYAGLKLRNRTYFNVQTTITQRLLDI